MSVFETSMESTASTSRFSDTEESVHGTQDEGYVHSSAVMLPWLPVECITMLRSDRENASTTHSFSSNCNGTFMNTRDYAREQEARRLVDLIHLFERGKLSQRRIRAALRNLAVNASFTYDVIMAHIRKRSGILLYERYMCRLGHAAVYVREVESVSCPATECSSQISSNGGLKY